MAIQILVGDILLARAWCTAGGQAAVNTYGYECIASAGAGATDVDFLSQLTGSFSAFYKGLLPPNCTYDGLQGYFIARPSGGVMPPPVSDVTGAGAGVTGTTCIPRGMAGIMKYATNIRGPGGRGRVFLPFVSQNYQDTTALPTNAYQVFVNSFASALLATLIVGTGGNTVTLIWSLVHRKKPDPITGHQITTAESAQKWGQMHKRGEYGRLNASPI